MKLTVSQIALIQTQIAYGPRRTIVLVDVPPGAGVSANECNNNIYCLDVDTNIVWQVSAAPVLKDFDTFVSLERKGRSVYATRFFGDEFRIDGKTGIAKFVRWHK